MEIETTADGIAEKRPRWGALEIALAADLGEVKNMLNGEIRNSIPKMKHPNLRSVKARMAQYQHGSQMSATECWARSYSREK